MQLIERVQGCVWHVMHGVYVSVHVLGMWCDVLCVHMHVVCGVCACACVCMCMCQV